ncbi:pyridoxal phosphate-dependent aminotransferase [Agrobacterium salinitolerans]|uniref:pyridoxal phosphate-dependent aminotransferase n=1 Tax=Agrobacterium salinitolerans TaxID=1183413 RepID=UPI001571D1B1|nr:pyridoxal phosphate-dependent aminotransferase [Agrobacterium salinitolerans]NTA40133.1 pyridoxal phosphate-dependent aminotransferase [Agrobacterium salinitolerans]
MFERYPFSRADRLHGIEVSGIVRISEAAALLKAEGKHVIDLGVGEPDFPTPEHVVDAAFQAARSGKTRYTANSGTPELRAAIGKRHDATEKEVLVSTGAKQVIFNALMATLNADDEVIFAAPFWTTYMDMVQIVGGRAVVVQTAETGLKITPEQLEKAITKRTRWLLLNNPGNPSGAVYRPDELIALADVLRRHPQIAVMSDEIYREISYTPFVSFRDAVPDLRERMLVVDGASKAYAMTGWRIGWGVGPQSLIGNMSIVQGQSTSCASSISQAAVLAALTGPDDYLDERRRSFRDRSLFLVEKLRATRLFDCAAPEGAFYLFPRCARALGMKQPDGKVVATDDDVSRYLMQEAHVAVVPGGLFGSPGHLRMSYALNQNELADACRRIAEACERLTPV